MEIECGRNLLYKACWLRDHKRPFAKEAAMAKLYCSELMGRVANHAVQIHGGYGLMKEYHVERFYRDQKLAGHRRRDVRGAAPGHLTLYRVLKTVSETRCLARNKGGDMSDDVLLMDEKDGVLRLTLEPPRGDEFIQL